MSGKNASKRFTVRTMMEADSKDVIRFLKTGQSAYNDIRSELEVEEFAAGNNRLKRS